MYKILQSVQLGTVSVSSVVNTAGTVAVSSVVNPAVTVAVSSVVNTAGTVAVGSVVDTVGIKFTHFDQNLNFHSLMFHDM